MMEPLRCGKTGKINVFISSLATHYHLPRLLGAQHDHAAAARRFSARQTHATRSFALILYSIACMRILAHNMSWFTANGPTDGFLASNASIAVWIAVSSSSERKAFVIFWLPAARPRPRVLVLDRLHEDFSA